jgi:hypothetical protein
VLKARALRSPGAGRTSLPCYLLFTSKACKGTEKVAFPLELPTETVEILQNSSMSAAIIEPLSPNNEPAETGRRPHAHCIGSGGLHDSASIGREICGGSGRAGPTAHSPQGRVGRIFRARSLGHQHSKRLWRSGREPHHGRYQKRYQPGTLCEKLFINGPKLPEEHPVVLSGSKRSTRP